MNDQPEFRNVADATGREFRIPHPPSIEDEPPFDTSGFTDWEKQEARQLWRESVRNSHQLLDCALSVMRDLYELSSPPVRWTLDAGGASQPNYTATQLTVSITRMLGVINGATHRQAVDRWSTTD